MNSKQTPCNSVSGAFRNNHVPPDRLLFSRALLYLTIFTLSEKFYAGAGIRELVEWAAGATTAMGTTFRGQVRLRTTDVRAYRDNKSPCASVVAQFTQPYTRQCLSYP